LDQPVIQNNILAKEMEMNKTFRNAFIICVVTVVTIWAVSARAAITAEEAAQLGKNLTPVGAEKAGNADGSIPAYTGGLTTPPAGFVPGSGVYPDPHAEEKPLFSISAANMSQYEDKLCEGQKALLKQYPDWRIDVYKTHRSVWFPQYVNDNTIKNAGKATLTGEGPFLENVHAAYPFPIPKTGAEAMWNHLVSYAGVTYAVNRGAAYVVDRSGRATLAGDASSDYDIAYWDSGTNDTMLRYQSSIFYGPPRKNGEQIMIHYPTNGSLRIWQYLPGQRRVKLAPEAAFDTPDIATAGLLCYDDNYIFNGSMERYDWKLLGKKEMIVAYNGYKFLFSPKLSDLGPHFFNPDALRFELHRVWIVEATLKSGKRHVYHKRVFYLDEDSWAVLLADQYDANGALYNAKMVAYAPYYDVGGALAWGNVAYNFISGQYGAIYFSPDSPGHTTKIEFHKERRPASYYSPDALSGRGVR
jgi:hypothetical protein